MACGYIVRECCTATRGALCLPIALKHLVRDRGNEMMRGEGGREEGEREGGRRERQR